MKTFKKIVVDMVPVILGVLVALIINSRKEDYDDRKFVKRIYAAIEKEMDLNLKEFEETLPKQYALIDTLNKYENDEQVSLLDILGKTSGMQIPSVKNTAWNSFLNSKLELVDFEVVSNLTDIEEGKRFMHVKFDKLMDFILSNSNSTSKGAKQLFVIHLLNVLDTEEQLVKEYKLYKQIEK